jgi:anti-sigma regulatory factor (Ser/Thr protein kinase)
MNGSPARERLTVSWSERIAGGPASAGVVRELLTRRVGDAVSEERLHDVLLLATELVTNAVLHAGVGEDDTLELHVSGQAGRLRVSVADPGGATRPQVQDLDPAVPGGMGLFLVEQISDRWGVQRRLGSAGSDVWFEVTRS